MLGISKKSLDDYYYQLRLGEKYDFDFILNVTSKRRAMMTRVINYFFESKYVYFEHFN